MNNIPTDTNVRCFLFLSVIKFEIYYNFKHHIDAIHRGMKPFGCKQCRKRFTKRSDAERHTERYCRGPNVEVEEAGELKP